MSIHNPAIMADPAKVSYRNGHIDGQLVMRDRLASMLAGWAVDHPSNIITDELMQFVDDMRRVSPL